MNEIQTKWVADNKVRESRREPCIAEVVGLKMCRDQFNYGHYRDKKKRIVEPNFGLTYQFIDHTSLWKGDNGLIFVTQPYHLPDYSLESMRIISEEYDLFVEYDPIESWHYPGECHFVTVRKAP